MENACRSGGPRLYLARQFMLRVGFVTIVWRLADVEQRYRSPNRESCSDLPHNLDVRPPLRKKFRVTKAARWKTHRFGKHPAQVRGEAMQICARRVSAARLPKIWPPVLKCSAAGAPALILTAPSPARTPSASRPRRSPAPPPRLSTRSGRGC